MTAMLIKLAIRNVFRQRIRSTMTITAIVFGVLSLIISGGFVQDIYVQLGESIIRTQTGHIQIYRAGFLERGTRQPERYLIDEPEGLARKIEALPDVREVALRLSFSGLLNNGKRDLAVLGEGIQPENEAQEGQYLSVIEGRNLSEGDTFEAMIGQGVARSLGLKAGDQITVVANSIQGSLNTIDLEVVGVFQSFSKDYDARAIRISLQAAQDLVYSNSANALVIALESTEDTDKAHHTIRNAIDAQFEVSNWKTLSDFYANTVALYERQFGVLRLIILVMVVLSVTNTVNMSVVERLGEFGTMQAMGNKPWLIARLILTENFFLGLIGGLLGALLGCLAAVGISAIGIPMPPPPNSNLGYTAEIRLVPADVLTAFVIGFAATILATVLPARRIARTSIIDALHEAN